MGAPASLDLSKNQDYQFLVVSSKAREHARLLQNVRGSVATPEYMEQKARETAKNAPQVKDIKVIKGQELLDNNMNLFHAVGRAANSEPRAVFIKYIGDESRADQIDLA